jgi:hypothetical protein
MAEEAVAAVHLAHGALHGAVPDAVQGLLAGVSAVDIARTARNIASERGSRVAEKIRSASAETPGA